MLREKYWMRWIVHTPSSPVNTTVRLGSTAQFVCSATDVISIFYYVDYMPFSAVASRGVNVSAPTTGCNQCILDHLQIAPHRSQRK